MKTFFGELFECNRHMNNELIKAMVEQQDMITDKSLELMNHILNAQQRWNCRVKKDPNMFGTWDLHAVDELVSINEANTQVSLDIIKDFELDTVISYIDPQGNPYKKLRAGYFISHHQSWYLSPRADCHGLPPGRPQAAGNGL